MRKKRVKNEKKHGLFIEKSVFFLVKTAYFPSSSPITSLPFVMIGEMISQIAESAISVYTMTANALLAPPNSATRLKLKNPKSPQFNAPTITRI